MTIEELSSVAPPAAYEKAPPQDVAAEQCVLGGMMLSKDAIADVVEILRVGDFYRPVHATVFNAILDLYGRGEPADAITVAASLESAGELGRVGGGPYLHTLISAVPTAANASYYARIVSERAVLRRLVEAGTKIVQLGYGNGAGHDVDDIVDLAQQAIYDVTEKRISEDFAVLADMLQPTLDEIEAVGAQGGLMTGVPTGFTDLDRLLNGLQAGQLIVVAGRPGLGKALALDTPLPTPTGWTTMGQVRAGDQLLGADGKPTTVLRAFEVMDGRPCYEVHFSDGSTILADAEHLWKTSTRASRRQTLKGSNQWAADDRAAVIAASNRAEDQPDSLITLAEAVTFAGPKFRHVMHLAAAEVGASGEGTGEYKRAGRPWQRRVPAYSRRALMTALQRRVNRLMNQETTAAHDQVITTAEVASTLHCGGTDRLNHAVATCRPLQLPAAELPIPPYTLGVWLGDGTSAAAHYTSADPEIATYIEVEGLKVTPSPSARYRYCISVPALPPLADRECAACGVRFTPRYNYNGTCSKRCTTKLNNAGTPVPPAGRCHNCGQPVAGRAPAGRRCQACHQRYGSFVGALRAVGVYANKLVPPIYLRGSEQQRRDLLAGLLDTDGTVAPTGNVQFTSTNRSLAEGVYELVVSLGYRCSLTMKAVKGRTESSSTAYTINFSTIDEVFRLTRKRSAHRERRRSASVSRSDARYITAVTPVPSVPVRCVTVDNPDHLYLAGRSMIPTHNSTASMDFARHAAVRHNLASAIFSLEMSKVEIVMRLLSAEARVPLNVLRSGQLSDDDWTKLARRMGEISEAPASSLTTRRI